jgi:hypothetical protein
VWGPLSAGTTLVRLLGRHFRFATSSNSAISAANLRYWFGKHATGQSEHARVHKGVDQEVRRHGRAGDVSRSIGYRAFADHAIATSSGSCPS